jgi:hypothetical protein
MFLLPQNCTRGSGTLAVPWSQAQEINIYRNNSKNDGVRGLVIHILCFEKRLIHV